jgi:DNA-binding LacI/PurR family transcriptional regulator
MQIKKEQVTLRDIAKNLNISISTVSRALRNAPEISKKTRNIVTGMAKKLNYQPNQVAQSLRTKKTNTLGIIVPDIVTHFFSANISGIQEMTAKEGYNIIICQSNECYETEVKYINTLVASRVDGLLISLSRETTASKHLKTLENKNIPFVLFDRVSEEINTSKITVDDHDGAFKATEHLIEMGCKRIAHLSGPEKLSISKSRVQGYLDALNKNGIQPAAELLRHSSLSEEDIIAQVNTLLDLPQLPDAIFAINDPVAIKAMLMIKERGLKIPEDIALVGFTNEPVSALIEPSLSTVAQPAYQIGQIAARQVLEQINEPDNFTPQSIVLQTELIVRNSSRKVMN